MQTVIETRAYLRAALQAGIGDDERETIVLTIAQNPEAGVALGGGFYKLRVAGRGKGKSGGFRVVTFYRSRNYPVFLITAFGKGERDNLSQSEMNELQAMGKELIDSLRARASAKRTRTSR